MVRDMTFLELTTDTAPAARSCIRSFSPLPTTYLRPSRSASALQSLQETELLRIDAHTSLLASHLEEVAAFASKVEQVDTRFGKGLAP